MGNSDGLDFTKALTALVEASNKTAYRISVDAGLARSSVHRWIDANKMPPLAAQKAIEDTLGIRRGEILRLAGYLEDDGTLSTRERIAADPALTEASRRVLVAAYDAAVNAS